jgi:hypothetical protein
MRVTATKLKALISLMSVSGMCRWCALPLVAQDRECPMLRKLYRLDEAARRMRMRVLSVVFGTAVAIIIAKIVFDFVGH